MLGRAQRYVADMKAEVSRSIEVEELQRMKREFETGARDVENSLTRDLDQAKRGRVEAHGRPAGGPASR